MVRLKAIIQNLVHNLDYIQSRLFSKLMSIIHTIGCSQNIVCTPNTVDYSTDYSLKSRLYSETQTEVYSPILNYNLLSD